MFSKHEVTKANKQEEDNIIPAMIEQLVNMREVVCDDCRRQIVDKVIQQLEGK
jgi:hypothetical protein